MDFTEIFVALLVMIFMSYEFSNFNYLCHEFYTTIINFLSPKIRVLNVIKTGVMHNINKKFIETK